QMLQRGKNYIDAHNENANTFEATFLRQKYDVSHAAFNKALAPSLKLAETEGAHASDIPHDLDPTPYVDSGEHALLNTAGAKKRANVPPEPKLPVPAYDATPEQLSAHADSVNNRNRDVENAILGDQADAWRKAHRQSNSYDTARADAGSKKVSDIEETLHPKDVEALYGVGETSEGNDDFKDFQDAHARADVRSPEEAAAAVSSFLPKLGNTEGREPSKWNRDQQVAYAGMRAVRERIDSEGWNSADIQKRAIQMAAGKYSDASDAELMLNRFLKPAEKARPISELRDQARLPPPVTSLKYGSPEEVATRDPASIAPLSKEIGWQTRGGQMIRGGDVENDPGTGAGFGRTSGDVVGRTPWVSKSGPNGEQDFWNGRPAEGGKISEAGAHKALAKYKSGEVMNARERRFVAYAHAEAKSRDDAFHAEMEQFHHDRTAEDDESASQARQAMLEDSIPPADHAEALTLTQLVERAHAAGAEPSEIIDATFEGDTSEAMRKLWDLVKAKEQAHGTDTLATNEGGQVDARSNQGEQAAARQAGGADQAEPATAGRAEVPARAPETSRLEVGGDMFGAATPQDRIRAETERRNSLRNGHTGGTDKSGAGGLFDGKRPAQSDIENNALSTADKADELTPAEMQSVSRQRQAIDGHEQEQAHDTTESDRRRKVSQDRGETEAEGLGLRKPVDTALGGRSAGRVHFVHDEEGLPKNVRDSLPPMAPGRVRRGLHTPDGNTYLFTKHVRTPEDAVWTALHEVGGHDGFQRIVEDHPAVRVGDKTVGQALATARDRLLQNPKIRELADAIGKQRNSIDSRRMAEEAMAELQAAKRSNSWAKLEAKYKVDIPADVRHGLQSQIAHFVRRAKAIMKAVYNSVMAKVKPGFKPEAEPFTDADVHDMLDKMWKAAQDKGAAAGGDAM
ncbi:MAG: hypothetical protein ABI268_13410, partial [Rhodanobacter sp.]